MDVKYHYRVNTYLPSLDKIVSELKSRFEETQQEVLCALGDIVMRTNVTDASFQIISSFHKKYL